MRSLNEIIKLIQTTKENHGQLSDGTFYFGDEWEFGQGQNLEFPFTGVMLMGWSIEGNLHTTNLNIFLADRVLKGELNETEVLNDMHLIALDIYAQLKLALESNDPTTTAPATISTAPSITAFTQGFLDSTAGVQMNIGIVQFYDRQTCNIPT